MSVLICPISLVESILNAGKVWETVSEILNKFTSNSGMVKAEDLASLTLQLSYQRAHTFLSCLLMFPPIYMNCFNKLHTLNVHVSTNYIH